MARANGITRQEILTCIKLNGAMTADALAKQMGISQVAVRQHLASLEGENLIMVRVERRGLGRPSHRYSLTSAGDETFPRHYDRAAIALLDEVRTTQGSEAVERLLEAQRTAGQDGLAERLACSSLGAKVRELARIQTEAGFMAESCQDSATVYQLIKHNCAVCAIARHYPSICCHGEAGSLGTLLGASVTLERAIIDGETTCALRIEGTPPST